MSSQVVYCAFNIFIRYQHSILYDFLHIFLSHANEFDDQWRTIRLVQAGLKCDTFNVAVQDGMGAKQSVPHIHVHIVPHHCGDLEPRDNIYDQLESWAPRDELSQNKPKNVVDDSERCDRTLEEMAEEILCYRSLFAP